MHAHFEFDAYEGGEEIGMGAGFHHLFVNLLIWSVKRTINLNNGS